MAPKSTRLGELLRARRTQRGYSRTRAAELSGINASSIEAWELGRVSKPPIHDVVKLARVLSIPMHELERAVMDEAGPDATATDGEDTGGDSVSPAVIRFPQLYWTRRRRYRCCSAPRCC